MLRDSNSEGPPYPVTYYPAGKSRVSSFEAPHSTALQAPFFPRSNAVLGYLHTSNRLALHMRKFSHIKKRNMLCMCNGLCAEYYVAHVNLAEAEAPQRIINILDYERNANQNIL
jgi:hypothetical protein